jgi:site-specific DNA-methyltransferase (cytosine-N4-specific)
MNKEKTLTLWSDLSPQQDAHDWTFNGASTRELTHCYHDYPARMIPPIAGKLLDNFARTASLLFDPYCGSGTSLVEGMVRGISVVGTDLNPLARLIAQAKTSTPGIIQIDRLLTEFYQFLYTKQVAHPLPTKIEGISRLEFWFKPEVIVKLSKIKFFIEEIDDISTKLFFQVAFSETVRESSNTRNEEFKLYRYEAERLEKFNPDVFGMMLAKLNRNREGLKNFLSVIEKTRYKSTSNIYDFNTVIGTPADKISASKVDIVITSPPYGDSHTTVAYGQYSRLSAAWIGLSEPERVDNKLLGGKVGKEIPRLPSPPLEAALNIIKKSDQRRAREVATFYADLFHSISHVAGLIRVGGYACYVVGNRKVKGVTLPTDEAVRHFFEQFGFKHVDTFHRSIPNKRMPLRNSPTNTIGAVDSTMTREYIVVMSRQYVCGGN